MIHDFFNGFLNLFKAAFTGQIESNLFMLTVGFVCVFGIFKLLISFITGRVK